MNSYNWEGFLRVSLVYFYTKFKVSKVLQKEKTSSFPTREKGWVYRFHFLSRSFLFITPSFIFSKDHQIFLQPQDLLRDEQPIGVYVN